MSDAGTMANGTSGYAGRKLDLPRLLCHLEGLSDPHRASEPGPAVRP